MAWFSSIYHILQPISHNGDWHNSVFYFKLQTRNLTIFQKLQLLFSYNSFHLFCVFICLFILLISVHKGRNCLRITNVSLKRFSWIFLINLALLVYVVKGCYVEMLWQRMTVQLVCIFIRIRMGVSCEWTCNYILISLKFEDMMLLITE